MQAIKSHFRTSFSLSDEQAPLPLTSVTRLEGLRPFYANPAIDGKHHVCRDETDWHLHRTPLVSVCSHQQAAVDHCEALMTQSLRDRKCDVFGRTTVPQALLGRERSSLSVNDLRVLDRAVGFIESAHSLGITSENVGKLLGPARPQLLADSPDIPVLLGRTKFMLNEARCDANAAWSAALESTAAGDSAASSAPAAAASASAKWYDMVASKHPPTAPPDALDRPAQNSKDRKSAIDDPAQVLASLALSPSTQGLLRQHEGSRSESATALVDGAPADIASILANNSTTPECRRGLAQTHVRDLLAVLERWPHAEGSDLVDSTANTLRFRLLASTGDLLDHSLSPSDFDFRFSPACLVNEQVDLIASWAASCRPAKKRTVYPLISAIEAVRQLLAPYAPSGVRGDLSADVFIHAAQVAGLAPPGSQRELHALTQCLMQVPLAKLNASQRAALEPGFKLLWQLATTRNAIQTVVELEALAPKISTSCARWVKAAGGDAPVSAPEPGAASRAQQASASLADDGGE